MHPVVAGRGHEQDRRVRTTGQHVVVRREALEVRPVGRARRGRRTPPSTTRRRAAGGSGACRAAARSRRSRRTARGTGSASRPSAGRRCCRRVMPSRSGVVTPVSTRSRATAAKSSNARGRCSRRAARCHRGPYSPPPRMLATTYAPPRASHVRPTTPSYAGVSGISKPPYPVSRSARSRPAGPPRSTAPACRRRTWRSAARTVIPSASKNDGARLSTRSTQRQRLRSQESGRGDQYVVARVRLGVDHADVAGPRPSALGAAPTAAGRQHVQLGP